MSDSNASAESLNQQNKDTKELSLWNIIESGKKNAPKFTATVCWDCVHQTLEDMGFRTHWTEGQGKESMDFIRVQNNILTKVTREVILHTLYEEHIRWTAEHETISFPSESGGDIPIRSSELREAWKRGKHNILSRDQLYELKAHTDPILRDKESESFVPFRNCVVKVTSEGMVVMKYEDLRNVSVWKSHIIQRDFTPHSDPDSFMFADFIRNVSAGDLDRELSFVTAMGYLCHTYTSGDVAVAVIAYDDAVNDGKLMNGGTGKGIIGQAIAHMRNVCPIDGKSYGEDNHFQWNDITDETQIVHLDDPNKKFKLNRLFNLISGGLNIQRKYEGSRKKRLADSPKWYIASNVMLEAGDSSSDRRQHILTFSDYYSSRLNKGSGKPVTDTHGCKFFEGWNPEQWTAFDTYMMNCVSFYLKTGLKKYTSPTIAISHIASGTSPEFFDWVQYAGIEAGSTYQDRELLDRYIAQTEDTSISPRTFIKHLKVYAKFSRLKMERIGGGNKTLSFTKVTE